MKGRNQCCPSESVQIIIPRQLIAGIQRAKRPEFHTPSCQLNTSVTHTLSLKVVKGILTQPLLESSWWFPAINKGRAELHHWNKWTANIALRSKLWWKEVPWWRSSTKSSSLRNLRMALPRRPSLWDSAAAAFLRLRLSQSLPCNHPLNRLMLGSSPRL